MREPATRGTAESEDARMSKSDIICPCRHVSRQDVIDAVADGAQSMHDIKKMTKASTKCGKCAKKVETCLEQALSKDGGSAGGKKGKKDKGKSSKKGKAHTSGKKGKKD